MCAHLCNGCGGRGANNQLDSEKAREITCAPLSLSAEANEAETAEDAEIRDRWMDTRGQEDGEDLERRIRYTITTTLMMT